jgi:hypothetical protein
VQCRFARSGAECGSLQEHFVKEAEGAEQEFGSIAEHKVGPEFSWKLEARESNAYPQATME